MGFRFRKSINLGGGFKVNISKSGVGYSWGTKGVRYTKTASGKKRTTMSLPGTGISYVSETGKGKASTPNKSPKSSSHSTRNNRTNNNWLKFVVCFFFGFLGVHKFMERKIGVGLLYLFTMGLFGVGWFYDCIRYLIFAIKATAENTTTPIEEYENCAMKSTDYPRVEPQRNFGFTVKNVLLWILTIFLLLISLVYFPHISGITALMAAIIMAPIKKWQTTLSRFINRKAKNILITAMAILAIFSAPTSDSMEEVPAVVIETVASTECATALVTTETATEPETVPSAEIERISFDKETDVIGVGRTVEIPFVLYPENASSDTLEVSVDNTEIAKASLEKKDDHILQITGVLPGEVTLVLKSGETITATKKITIAEVMPEEIMITAKPQPIRIGSSGNFTADFEPQDVTNRNVAWESDAPNVIRVNEDGSYEALSIGTATITATHENGVIGTIRAEVLPIEVETITLGTDWEEGKYFCKNSSMTLTAEVEPENATEKALSWYSSDESVANVSEKGVVKAVSPGTAIITAEATNGITATYEITVDVSPQKFRVSASISMQSNDHVGNNWTSGFEFNDEAIRSGSTVSIMPGETFTVCGWAQDNDSKPDYGSYWERLTLTEEMCQSGFSLEGNANVYENGGRYSGNCAVWYVKITFTPTN